MSLRVKLGPFLSFGRTGFRLHLPGHNFNASAGRSDARGYAKLGPFYWVGGRK